jgi:hypothetical protein
MLVNMDNIGIVLSRSMQVQAGGRDACATTNPQGPVGVSVSACLRCKFCDTEMH